MLRFGADPLRIAAVCHTGVSVLIRVTLALAVLGCSPLAEPRSKAAGNPSGTEPVAQGELEVSP
ncbi:MAG: hypothetical protein ACI9K2_000187, partial [Myxococcota bacterium]